MIERDQYLSEKMGECWHDKQGKNYPPFESCSKCNKMLPNNNNFSTWEGFGKLWEWSETQSWWGEFVKKYGELSCDCGCNDGYMALHFIKPKGNYNFPTTVYEFLKEKESK